MAALPARLLERRLWKRNEVDTPSIIKSEVALRLPSETQLFPGQLPPGAAAPITLAGRMYLLRRRE